MSWLLILALNTAPLPPRTELQGFVSNQQLHAICAPSLDSDEPGPALCLGYLAGATDQIVAREARRPALRRRICLPDETTLDDVRELVLKFQEKGAATDEVAAADVVRAVLEARFPCGRGKERP